MWNEHDGFHEVKEWTNLNRKKKFSDNYYHRKLQKSGKKSVWIKRLYSISENLIQIA